MSKYRFSLSNEEHYLDRLYDNVFPDWLRHREEDELEARCCYCGDVVDNMEQQFCSENCEYLYYIEADLYWSDREEEYRKEKEEE